MFLFSRIMLKCSDHFDSFSFCWLLICRDTQSLL
eukprot:UN28721